MAGCGVWTTNGIYKYIFEGDSLEVVNALRSDDSCWTQYGMMINEEKEGLLRLQKWNVQHVRREANAVAHRLAKEALVLGDKNMARSYFLYSGCNPCG
ncbi:hypothetical protein FH972_019600 [Carpinus fangiana]|uniref:RNase H type-1 domain-containing protein n=1 Tax=Carpinus fangiana TaxID=176857 RepID=A0A5N6RU50_9ROSI|nr:hypothetical protein FH972_019600 [Carpinus fangiana]